MSKITSTEIIALHASLRIARIYNIDGVFSWRNYPNNSLRDFREKMVDAFFLRVLEDQYCNSLVKIKLQCFLFTDT